MLNKQERNQLLEHVRSYPEPRAGLTYVLQYLQQRAGYLSDAAVAEAANLTGLSEMQVNEIITFYTLLYRRPTGRHIVRLCDSLVCSTQGSASLFAHAERVLGVPTGTDTPDGAITVLPSICLGLCDHAPAALVDEAAAGPLDEASLAAILENLQRNEE